MSKAVNVDYSSFFDVFYDFLFFYRVPKSQLTTQQNIQIMDHAVFNV
jgi:hypothetical protein